MAASCNSTPDEVLRKVGDLSIEKVALDKKKEGKDYLAECLGWEQEKLDDDRCQLRDLIKLDYCYDVIEFCSKKGFPWHQIKKLLLLAYQFMEQSTGVTLHEAIKLYQHLAVSNSGEINAHMLQVFTGYIFATYVHHFRLYQLVLTEARDEFVIKAEAEIEPPGNVFPLQDAKPQHIHEYHQRLQVIEQEEMTRKEDLKQERELLNNQTQDRVTRLNMKEDIPVTRELLEEIIQKSSRNQCAVVEKLLHVKVEEKHEGLNFYLEKTLLPRPAELGPPPRTKQVPNQSANSRLSTTTKASVKSTPSRNGKKGSKK